VDKPATFSSRNSGYQLQLYAQQLVQPITSNQPNRANNYGIRYSPIAFGTFYGRPFDSVYGLHMCGSRNHSLFGRRQNQDVCVGKNQIAVRPRFPHQRRKNISLSEAIFWGCGKTGCKIWVGRVKIKVTFIKSGSVKKICKIKNIYKNFISQQTFQICAYGHIGKKI